VGVLVIKPPFPVPVGFQSGWWSDLVAWMRRSEIRVAAISRWLLGHRRGPITGQDADYRLEVVVRDMNTFQALLLGRVELRAQFLDLPSGQPVDLLRELVVTRAQLLGHPGRFRLLAAANRFELR